MHTYLLKGVIKHMNFITLFDVWCKPFKDMITRLFQKFGANLEQIYKNRPPRHLEGRLWCLGRESNPYGHCWPRDFLATLAFTQAGFILNAKPL